MRPLKTNVPFPSFSLSCPYRGILAWLLRTESFFMFHAWHTPNRWSASRAYNATSNFRTQKMTGWLGSAFGTRKSWSLPFVACLGALDGSHIPVKAEGWSLMSYLNWHGWFSINLIAIVDAKMSFVHAFTGCPGRIGDSRVFKDSSFYRRMVDSATRLFPSGYFFIGVSSVHVLMSGS